MQTHLLESMSSDPLIKKVGLNKLDLCMMIMSQLEETYPAATLIRGLFLEAIDKVHSQNHQSMKLSQNDTFMLATPNTSDTASSDMETMFAVDNNNALLANTALFDFWDPYFMPSPDDVQE
jgi:hypothetical protein